MDNFISSASRSSCIIKLDQHQYAFYLKSRLEIYSPDNRFLTAMAKPLPSKTDEDAIYQLWCQACVLELLFDQVNERIKLPQRAINSLVHVLDRINAHLNRQVRVQSSN